jgi:uncharacterized protein (TIGR03435 family)
VRGLFISAFFSIVGCCTLFGQEPKDPLVFEVASVKPVTDVVPAFVHGGPGTDDPGRITFGRIPLTGLLTFAYETQFDQVLGPDWLSVREYEVIAKIPKGATTEQVHVMMQNLLIERFKLALHHETRQFLVYELTVGKSGSKLKPAVDPDARPLKPGDVNIRSQLVDENGFPKMPPGISGVTSKSVNGVKRSTYRAFTMARFVSGLDLGLELGVWNSPNAFARGRIIDKTGLSGKYDFTLEYASAGGLGGAQALGQGVGVDGVSGGPTLFEALQEQLGLKLVKTKSALDVLVIDRAEKIPVEN